MGKFIGFWELYENFSTTTIFRIKLSKNIVTKVAVVKFKACSSESKTFENSKNSRKIFVSPRTVLFNSRNWVSKKFSKRRFGGRNLIKFLAAGSRRKKKARYPPPFFPRSLSVAVEKDFHRSATLLGRKVDRRSSFDCILRHHIFSSPLPDESLSGTIFFLRPTMSVFNITSPHPSSFRRPQNEDWYSTRGVYYFINDER